MELVNELKMFSVIDDGLSNVCIKLMFEPINAHM